ncbi:MAG: mannitol-1-phosphate 5-dehydrogenase [Alphaproteobacteria bacterium]|jgi:mannitol-1-phosphate 5-dehydrogenase|nr:mannitol-1-phosphate 5-dehydrogenase [Alphaproteobacteria bacterium]
MQKAILPKAIQFGAGNIGRGLVAPVIHDNYFIIFADTNESIIDAINKEESYTVRVLGESVSTIEINNIMGINAKHPDLPLTIARADLITTAVGPTVLEYIAPTIASGIKCKIQDNITTYLNIIACENMLGATTHLKSKIIQYLTDEEIAFMDKYVGFNNCMVDRIVPPSQNKQNILEVSVEDFYEWIVDKSNFKGEIPNIAGLKFTSALDKYVERKIFTLNTGHAITAYLGFLYGKPTIKDAIEDDGLAHDVRGAMNESAEVLYCRYNVDKAEHQAYIEKIIKRFKNPYIVDEILRVARDPKRKLSFNDRLIKPLRGTIEYNLKNDYLIKGIAAALYFSMNCPEDKEALEIKALVESKGLFEAIKTLTQLTDDTIINKIVKAYSTL